MTFMLIIEFLPTYCRKHGTMKHFVIFNLIIVLNLFQNYSCGSIALTKCKEYAKAVYVETSSPILMRKSRKNLVSQCSIGAIPLIIGGASASEKEFPHMAVIGFGHSPTSKLSWNCGGALISDYFVLTAAHCMQSRQLGLSQQVKLGIVNIDDTDDDLQVRRIVRRIPHPRYSRATKANDIGLLKLHSRVKFTAYVRPACLNTKEIRPGRKVLASGFGKTHYDDDAGSKSLMKVTLNLYNISRCRRTIKRLSPSARNSILCAGEIRGGKDTCQGDSGGPLQIVLNDPYCMYSIIGVTSFGKFCGFANSPAVYSKVSKFVPWIESIVWR